jgi:hypothetical protein
LSFFPCKAKQSSQEEGATYAKKIVSMLTHFLTSQDETFLQLAVEGAAKAMLFQVLENEEVRFYFLYTCISHICLKI